MPIFWPGGGGGWGRGEQVPVAKNISVQVLIQIRATGTLPALTYLVPGICFAVNLKVCSVLLILLLVVPVSVSPMCFPPRRAAIHGTASTYMYVVESRYLLFSYGIIDSNWNFGKISIFCNVKWFFQWSQELPGSVRNRNSGLRIRGSGFEGNIYGSKALPPTCPIVGRVLYRMPS